MAIPQGIISWNAVKILSLENTFGRLDKTCNINDKHALGVFLNKKWKFKDFL